jgi:hypothetical protein
VWEVIRKIYGFFIDHHTDHPWQYWLEVARAADKYLEPDLVGSAGWNMAHYGFDRAGSTGHDCDPEDCDVEGTCEILDALREFDSNADIINAASRLASTLQKRHVKDSESFRSCMVNNPKVMLQLLEWSTDPLSMVLTSLDVCDHHMETYMSRTEPGSQCPWCRNDERPTERYNMWYLRCG